MYNDVPEGSKGGKDPVKLISEVLMQVMGPKLYPAASELERAHWTSTFQIWLRKIPPAHSWFVFLGSSRRKLSWARNHKLKYQETTIRVYQDLSAALAKKPAAFSGVKQALYINNE